MGVPSCMQRSGRNSVSLRPIDTAGSCEVRARSFPRSRQLRQSSLEYVSFVVLAFRLATKPVRIGQCEVEVVPVWSAQSHSRFFILFFLSQLADSKPV